MPYDYYRFTPSELRDLSEHACLTVCRLVPLGSYVSVFLTVNQLPLVKTMQKLQSRTGVPFGEPYNPLLYLLVVLPQKAYLPALRWFSRHPRSRLALPDELVVDAASYPRRPCTSARHDIRRRSHSCKSLRLEAEVRSGS
jgi:hypothetical protein